MVFVGVNMDFLKEEKGQGAAEYILLFGGVIVIAVVAILLYKSYFDNTQALSSSQDISKVRTSTK